MERPTEQVEIDFEALRTRLLRASVLFDDPHAYAAGVQDALEAVQEVVEPSEPLTVDLRTAMDEAQFPPAGAWFG